MPFRGSVAANLLLICRCAVKKQTNDFITNKAHMRMYCGHSSAASKLILLCRQVNKNSINIRPKYLYSTSATPESSYSILNLKPEEFADVLKCNETNRCMVWFDKNEQKFQVSHDFLQEISDFLAKSKYNKHETIFFELGKRTNLLLSAFVSNSNRGQAHGGIKLWPYNSIEELINSGLKLSEINTIKSALADLWIGGGKGIIPEPSERKHLNPDFRQEMCLDYGDFLTGLNGCFVGSVDAGLNTYDMNQMHNRTRYVTGMSADVGGLGIPVETVAKGIICAIQAILNFLKMGDLKGKSVAVQGAGTIGQVVICELLNSGVGHVYATDCSQKRVDDLKDLLSNKANGRLDVVKVPFGDNKILSRKCHVFSPCAIGNLITKDTLPLIQSKVICGLAYNQLGVDVSPKSLAENGITFVSDEIANRMGLVHDYIESQGRLPNDPLIERHFSRDWDYSIFATMKRILEKAKDDDIVVEEAAKIIAYESLRVKNPLWSNRTELIINSLVENEWHKSKDFWLKRSNFAGVRTG